MDNPIARWPRQRSADGQGRLVLLHEGCKALRPKVRTRLDLHRNRLRSCPVPIDDEVYLGARGLIHEVVELVAWVDAVARLAASEQLLGDQQIR